MEGFFSFWPWYITGPLIGLYVPLFYLLLNKHFGISSTFRDICAACLPLRNPYFRYNWQEHRWRLVFVAGIAIGAFLARNTLATPAEGQISDETLSALSSLGVRDFSSLVPSDLFSWQSLATLRGVILVVAGGFLVGFGTRYARGCTSGHAIHGMSTLQPASVIATLSFFAGGLVATNLLLPLVLRL